MCVSLDHELEIKFIIHGEVEYFHYLYVGCEMQTIILFTPLHFKKIIIVTNRMQITLKAGVKGYIVLFC